MGTASFSPRVKWLGTELTTHVQLVSRLRISGAILPLSHMACIGTTLGFLLCIVYTDYCATKRLLPSINLHLLSGYMFVRQLRVSLKSTKKVPRTAVWKHAEWQGIRMAQMRKEYDMNSSATVTMRGK